MKCKYCDYENPDGSEICACCKNKLSEDVKDRIGEDGDEIDTEKNEPPAYEGEEPFTSEDVYLEFYDPNEEGKKKRKAKKKKSKLCARMSSFLSKDNKIFTSMRVSLVVAICLVLALAGLIFVFFSLDRSEDETFTYSAPTVCYSPSSDEFLFIQDGKLIEESIKAYGGNMRIIVSDACGDGDGPYVTLYQHTYTRNEENIQKSYLVSPYGITMIESRNYNYMIAADDGKQAFLMTENEGYVYSVGSGKKEKKIESISVQGSFSHSDALMYYQSDGHGTTELCCYYFKTDKTEVLGSVISASGIYGGPGNEAVVYRKANDKDSTVYLIDQKRTLSVSGYYASNRISPSGDAVVINTDNNGAANSFLLKDGKISKLSDNRVIFVSDGGETCVAINDADGTYVRVSLMSGDSESLLVSEYINTIEEKRLFTKDIKNILYAKDDAVFLLADGKKEMQTQIAPDLFETLLFFRYPLSDFVGAVFMTPINGNYRYCYMDENYSLQFLDETASLLSSDRNVDCFFYTYQNKLYRVDEGVGTPISLGNVSGEIFSLFVSKDKRDTYFITNNGLFYSNGNSVKRIEENVSNAVMLDDVLYYITDENPELSIDSGVVCRSSKGGSKGKTIVKDARSVTSDGSTVLIFTSYKKGEDGKSVCDVYGGANEKSIKKLLGNVRMMNE